MWSSIIRAFVTFRKRFNEAVRFHSWTVEYPYVVRALPVKAHTNLKNNFLECTACLKCEEICPVDAIEIDTQNYEEESKKPVTSTGIKFERQINRFRIDYTKCVFCGLCVDVCPTESLTFTKSFLKPEMNPQALLVDLVHIPRSMRQKQT